MSDDYVPSAEEFAAIVAEHELTILHDDWLYRHLRCLKPSTGMNGFDIITYPGGLLYTGDMGSFCFERMDDMLCFFRQETINPDYWAQKVVAEDRDGVRKFDPKLAESEIRRWLDDAEADAETRDDVEWCVLDSMDEFDESLLRQAIRDLPLPHSDIFDDFHEATLTSFTYRFIFCCRAIVWAVQKYGQSRANPSVRGL